MNLWKLGCMVLVVVCVALGVALSFRPDVVVPPAVTKDRVVTVEKTVRPDGTVTSRSVTTEQSQSVAAQQKAKYSFQLTTSPFALQNDVRAELSARLGDLPLWGVLGGAPFRREIDIGVRYEWGK